MTQADLDQYKKEIHSAWHYLGKTDEGIGQFKCGECDGIVLLYPKEVCPYCNSKMDGKN